MQRPEDFDPFAPDTTEHPYPFYKALREHAPVYRVPGADYWAVSRYEDVRAVARDVETFSSNIVAILMSQGQGDAMLMERPDLDVGPADVLAIQDPPKHARQRKIVSGVISRESVRDMESEIRTIATELIDAVVKSGSSGGVSDWMTAAAFVLPMTVAIDLVGFPRADRDRVKTWCDHSIALLAGTNTPDAMAEHMTESMMFYEWIVATWREIAPSSTHPMLVALREGMKAGELTENEAASIILQILIAGSDSSASMMGSAVRMLAEDPELQASLRADPGQIPAFLEEVLRLESPFQGHFRLAKADAEIAGTKITKGERLMLLWAAANRDSEEFAEPDAVRLDRKNGRAHFGFGHGLHLCIGAPLARLEGRIVLEELLARTRSFELATTEYRHRPSAFVRTLEALPVGFTPR